MLVISDELFSGYMDVFVHLGCYKKNTGWLINHKHLFLTVLESGKSNIKVPVDLVSSES